MLQHIINLDAQLERLLSGGAILLRTGSQGNGVDLTVPEIIIILLFNSTSIFFVCTLFIHTGAQFSTVE